MRPSSEIFPQLNFLIFFQCTTLVMPVLSWFQCKFYQGVTKEDGVKMVRTHGEVIIFQINLVIREMSFSSLDFKFLSCNERINNMTVFFMYQNRLIL